MNISIQYSGHEKQERPEWLQDEEEQDLQVKHEGTCTTDEFTINTECLTTLKRLKLRIVGPNQTQQK